MTGRLGCNQRDCDGPEEAYISRRALSHWLYGCNVNSASPSPALLINHRWRESLRSVSCLVLQLVFRLSILLCLFTKLRDGCLLEKDQ